MADGVTKVRRKSSVKGATTRKKTVAAKKTATKKTAAEKKPGRAKLLARYSEQGEMVTEAYEKYDGDWAKIAKAVKMSANKARRLYARATVKPGDRIVGTKEEVGAEIARLRDEDNMPWAPELWARTGLGPGRMKSLYEETTGKSWKDSGIKAEKAAKGEKKARKAKGKKSANGGNGKAGGRGKA